MGGEPNNYFGDSSKGFEYHISGDQYVCPQEVNPLINIQSVFKLNIVFGISFGSLTHRMLYSLGVQTMTMVFIGLMALSDSVQKTSTVFPWMTIVANAVIYFAGGVHTSSAIGSVANMPEKYINALCLGIGLGGIIYPLSAIIGTYLGRDSKPMAMVFFTTLVVIHIVCVFLSITLESNVMYFLLTQILVLIFEYFS